MALKSAPGKEAGSPFPPNAPSPRTSPPRYDRVEGPPHIQVALGPRGTNSSLDDTSVRVVMPTWEQKPYQLAIPKD